MNHEKQVDWLMAWACPHGRFRGRRSNCHLCVGDFIRMVEEFAKTEALAECVKRVVGAPAKV